MRMRFGQRERTARGRSLSARLPLQVPRRLEPTFGARCWVRRLEGRRLSWSGPLNESTGADRPQAGPVVVDKVGASLGETEVQLLRLFSITLRVDVEGRNRFRLASDIELLGAVR